MELTLSGTPVLHCCAWNGRGSLSSFSRFRRSGFVTDVPNGLLQMACREISTKNVELVSTRSVKEERFQAKSYEDFLSRREILQTSLTFCGTSGFLASTGASGVLAEDCLTNSCSPLITRKVFFDVAIDRQSVGEIVVGLYGEVVPIGAQRFAELAIGQQGIGFRRKEFNKITPTYIQNAGLRSFSLSGGISDAAKITGGPTAESLVSEMAELDRTASRPKNVKGAVSLVVVNPSKAPPKPKLVARNGKFEIIEEEGQPDPNGTEFVIATADCPQLDASNLVVGCIVDGMDVVERIAQVKVVQENSSSPYFQAAKLIGDTRVVVAEKGFYRPYSKVVITRSGELT